MRVSFDEQKCKAMALMDVVMDDQTAAVFNKLV